MSYSGSQAVKLEAAKQDSRATLANEERRFKLYVLMFLLVCVHSRGLIHGTVGYLSFGPIEKILLFCDLCVREKNWRAASQAFERMHSTLSHRSKS